MDTIVSKPCARCHSVKPLADFYTRPPYNKPGNPPTLPGHYVSECKTCMKARGSTNYHPTVPRAKTEILAIDYLRRNGVYAVPGKSVYAADVDVVAWGCVWIEVKYALLQRGKFTFHSTPTQKERGYRAHVVILICDYGSQKTYHLFRSNHPVFYKDGRIKSGFTFTPGAMEAKKHGNNRVVMTQPLMDTAQNDTEMIEQARQQIALHLRTDTD